MAQFLGCEREAHRFGYCDTASSATSQRLILQCTARLGRWLLMTLQPGCKILYCHGPGLRQALPDEINQPG